MASLPICVFAQGQNQAPYLSKSFPKGSIKNVLVKTSGGSIEVKGGNEAEARVEVYVNANNGISNRLSKEEISERLSNYDLNVSVSNQQLIATARPKNNSMNWKKGLSISFKVFVPKEVSTDLNTSGGSINLSDLSGQHSFKTSGGSLNLQRLSGDIGGKTSGGSINVSDSRKNIDLETSGGSINARNCQGAVRLRTSGGSLNLEGLSGSVNATTSGGSVKASNIKGELITGTAGGSMSLNGLACSLESSTAAGSVHVQFAQLGKYVKISSGGGNVDLQVPSGKGLNLDVRASKINAKGLNNFSGLHKEDRIEGKLGGGGIPVEVSVSGGNVNLNVE